MRRLSIKTRVTLWYALLLILICALILGLMVAAAERTACAVAFCETIRSAGYSAGVYSYASWFYNALNFANISKYNIWIAQYRDTLSFSYKHNIWQYTGSGSVKGIAKPVDMNIG